MDVVNTDTLSYWNKSPEKFLQTAENEKRYLDSCIQKILNFHPFFVLVDGIFGLEAEATLKADLIMDVSIRQY